MKKIVWLILLTSGFYTANAQALKVIKFPALEKILAQSNDTTYVINFWATWCQPCIEELPDFEKVRESFKNKKVKFILISLDNVKVANTKVATFARKKQLKSELYLLDEPDGNTWMEKVDENWSGAIPATIIIKNAQKQFLEKPLSRQELEKYMVLMHEK